MSKAADGLPDYFVQSVARGLSVIRAFGADTPELTLSEVAQSIGLTRAGARRFLLTLVDLGYTRFDGKHFSLTPRVLELGYAYLSGLPVATVAKPHLESLAKETEMSTAMSVLDGESIVHVVRVSSPRSLSIDINIGARFPAYATTMGNALLSPLDDAAVEKYLSEITPTPPISAESLSTRLARVRTHGYAWADQEFEIGLRSLAVPVRNKDLSVVASINVSTLGEVTFSEMTAHFLQPLLRTARAIETDLRQI